MSEDNVHRVTEKDIDMLVSWQAGDGPQLWEITMIFCLTQIPSTLQSSRRMQLHKQLTITAAIGSTAGACSHKM